MKITQEIPKFHPRTLTFETQEEWDMFVDLIAQSEVIANHSAYDQLTDFNWRIYTMISEGLEKI